MSLENKAHDILMNFPVLKKVAKRVYQGVNVAVFRPKKSDGNIERITPDDEYEYLFGYYDKTPWDVSGRYMLCLRVKNASKSVAPKEGAEIVLIDTGDNNSIKVIAKTKTWNVQQGCMLGWLGPKYDKEIFYNDFRNGKLCGVIMNLETGKDRLLERPVYSVSNDGKIALSLDFARLHRLRPGYGYSNLEDKTASEKVPRGTCVWKIDMKSGKAKSILEYQDLYDFEHRADMEGADHKINHLMLSPDGKRFMIIHRWLKGGKKISRLLTCNIDGKKLYNLADEDMISHCYWKNSREILAYCRRGGENGYYLMKDKSKDYERKWDFLTADGHPSYSPDGNFVVTDTYPNRKRICTIRVLSDTMSLIVAKVYAPFKYDNDTRCDLHPRWSRDGKKICFDGCFEGKRGVYVVNCEKFEPKLSVVVPIFNTEKYLDRCIRSIITQSYRNLEIILVDDGSTDNSLSICRKYKKLDKRIKVFSQVNLGQGVARNYGVNKATGDYITFVDSDDWVDEDIYKVCMEKMICNDVQIIDFECKKVKNFYEAKDCNLKKIKWKILDNKSAIQYFMRRGLKSENCPYSVCRKIFGRDLINDNLFSEKGSNEDILVAFRTTKEAKRTMITNYTGYYYYQSQNSTTRGELSDNDLGIFVVCKKMLDESQRTTRRTVRYAKIKLHRCDFSILSRLALYGSDKSIDEKNLIKELLPRLKKNCFELLLSPIPYSRKILIVAYCINFKIATKIVRKIKRQ